MTPTNRNSIRRALAAFAVLGVSLAGAVHPATTDAGPNKPSIGGTYHGAIPGSHYGSWDVLKVSGGGKVSGKLNGPGSGGTGMVPLGTGTVSGHLGRDGTLSLAATEVYYVSIGFIPVQFDFTVSATMVLDAAGNLVGTTAGGTTFTWTRN